MYTHEVIFIANPIVVVYSFGSECCGIQGVIKEPQSCACSIAHPRRTVECQAIGLAACMKIYINAVMSEVDMHAYPKTKSRPRACAAAISGMNVVRLPRMVDLAMSPRRIPSHSVQNTPRGYI